MADQLEPVAQGQLAAPRQVPVCHLGQRLVQRALRLLARPPRTPVRVNGRHVPGILLIDETLDAATPFEGSLEVRRRYPKSSLIAGPGGTSHANSLSGNACVDDQIAAYLADGTLPPRKPGNRADALCAPLPQPVPNAEAASSTASANSRVATRLRQQLASRSFR